MALASAFTGFTSHRGLQLPNNMITGQTSKGHGAKRWLRYGRTNTAHTAISFDSFPSMGTVANGSRGIFRVRLVFRLPSIAPSHQMVLFSTNMGGSTHDRAGVLLNTNRTLQCWVNTVNGGAGAGLGPSGDIGAASAAIPLGFANNEGWVTLDIDVTNFANGASDEMACAARVYFADGTDEVLDPASASGSWAVSLQQSSAELFGAANNLAGFTNSGVSCEVDVAQYILIGANNADYGSVPSLPPVGTRVARCLVTGNGPTSTLAYNGSNDWWVLNKQLDLTNLNTESGLQTTTTGQQRDLTHQGVARLGATQTYGVKLVQFAQGTGSGTPVFMVGGSPVNGVGTLSLNAHCWYADLTTRDQATFDALAFGVQSVVTSGTYYCGAFEIEVLHDGPAAYDADELTLGQGYKHAWVAWTGDGAVDRTITGAGFRPQFAMLFAVNTNTPVKVAADVAGHASFGVTVTANSESFRGFTADGVRVGHSSGHSWNENGVSYVALLVRDDGSPIYDVSGPTPVVSGYTFLFTTGCLNNVTNSHNQVINFGARTVFAPGHVFLIPSTGASGNGQWKSVGMAATESAPFAATAAMDTTAFTSFDANGFTLAAVSFVSSWHSIWWAWSTGAAALVRARLIASIANALPAAGANTLFLHRETFELDAAALTTPTRGTTSNNRATSATTLTIVGHVLDAGADRRLIVSVVTYQLGGTVSCTFDGQAMTLISDQSASFHRTYVFEFVPPDDLIMTGDVVFTSSVTKSLISMVAVSWLNTGGMRWVNVRESATLPAEISVHEKDKLLSHIASDPLDSGDEFTYPGSPWSGLFSDGVVSGTAAAAEATATATGALGAAWSFGPGSDVVVQLCYAMRPVIDTWTRYFAMAKTIRPPTSTAGRYRLENGGFGTNDASFGSQTFGTIGLRAQDGTTLGIARTSTADPLRAEGAWVLAVVDNAAVLADSPPTGVDDAYSTPYQTELVVAAGSGVLANDNTNGGGTMTALLVADVAVGTLSLASDGSFTYSPPGGFSGNVTFTYRPVNDGGVGTIATVTITVGAPPPAAEVESAIVEVGLGGSYRNFWRARVACERFFDLGDCGTIVARDSSGDPSSTSPTGKTGAVDGTYSGEPVKGLGLLPEYGLATTFDGDDDYVVIDPGLPSSGAFTLVAMIRPAAGGAGTTRCLVQTGAGAGYLGITSGNAFTFGINGGSKISGGTAAAGQTYFVVGTYDGTTAYLYVGTPTSEAVLVASGALAISGHGSDGKIGANNSEEFVGEMQGVVTLSEYLVSGEVYSGWLTCEWTDVTDDVLDRVPLVIDRGIHSDRTDQRVAATGKLSLGLNNSQFNSAGTMGRYSPPNANAVSGFDRGTPIRVRLYSAEEHYPQFIGRIRSLKPDAGVWDGRGVVVVAHDWLEEAAKFSVKEVATTEDLRPDQAVEVIVNAMRNRPHGLSLATSSDTYPIVFDGAGEQKAITEFVKLMNSERGWLYVKGDGTLEMQTRSSRVGDGEPAWTFADTMTDVDPERSTDQLINRVKVTCHPRRVDAAPVVLYQADQSIQIDNGVTVTTFLQYRDPDQEASKVAGLDITAPVATTDYLINTAADGSGTNLTGNPNFVVTGTEGSNGYYFTVTNNYGERAYFTFLRVRGRGIYDYNPVTLIAEDVVAIEEDGLNELDIDLPYQDSATTAQDVASYELALGGSSMPTRVKQLRFKAEANANNLAAALQAEISDRVLVQEIVSGVNTEYLINGVRLSWGPNRMIVVTWWLVPADISGAPWIFDVSTFDETTTFGFG